LRAADTGRAVKVKRNNVFGVFEDALAETFREPLPAREIMRSDAGETERLPN